MIPTTSSDELLTGQHDAADRDGEDAPRVDVGGRRPPRLATIIAGVAAATFAVAVVAIDARATYGARTTADEPQYLLTALSLAEDGDLDISDELADERFRDFHEVDLDPQTIELDDTGQRLSPHGPLLPLLLAPGMAVGGWVGAKVVLAAIGAATAAATAWLAVRRFAVSPVTAGLVTGCLFAAPPLTSYATQVYPEIPAALCVVVGVAAVTGRQRPLTAGFATVAVVALPWLSVKYVPLAAVLTAALLVAQVRSRQQAGDGRPVAVPARRTTLATGAALVIAAVVYVAFHRAVYGGWTVYAAGDHFVDGEFLVIGTDPDYLARSRRLIGLIVDRGFGLAPWTPAYLAMPAAIAVLARRRPRGAVAVLAMLAVGWSVATWVALTMHGWWWPGRQVVVVLPLAVVALAMAVDGHPRRRALVLAASLAGTISWLWLVVEASTGRRTLVVDFAATADPWYRAWSQLFPDHQTPELADAAGTGVWIGVLALATVAAWRRGAPRSGDRPGAAR